ncbi:MAG: ornithine cyclodeaminase family protein [Planctomycetes bacterium]|nr:ornithine cyclodeaminase family protein [Planctomycetota bacterium]
MLVLDAAAVRQALPTDAAIEAMRRAFAALSAGRATMPPRSRLPIRRHDGISLVMPAFVDDETEQALAVKVVSLFDRNADRGLARIQAAVLVLAPETGRPVALLEGATLTAIRTGAASGLAADLLARPDARTAAILGAGVQARTQLEGLCAVRPIETFWVYDPALAAAEAFVRDMAGHGKAPLDIRRAASPREAVAQADIICAATTSRTPVFADADLKAGVHISAVGSYQPDVREVPTETVVRARVFVDSREAALEEAGDLIQPIRQGAITPDHIRAELGDLVLGRAAGRRSAADVTLFKSVGVAAQDAMAARAAIERALRLGVGQTVAW